MPPICKRVTSLIWHSELQTSPLLHLQPDLHCKVTVQTEVRCCLPDHRKHTFGHKRPIPDDQASTLEVWMASMAAITINQLQTVFMNGGCASIHGVEEMVLTQMGCDCFCILGSMVFPMTQR